MGVIRKRIQKKIRQVDAAQDDLVVGNLMAQKQDVQRSMPLRRWLLFLDLHVGDCVAFQKPQARCPFTLFENPHPAIEHLWHNFVIIVETTKDKTVIVAAHISSRVKHFF